MKKISNLQILSALFLAAAPFAVEAQTTFFTDDFTHGSTTNQLSVPGGTATASFTSYDLASAKNALANSSIAPNDLKLTLASATTSGFFEAQALFTNNAVALTSVGDNIDIAVVFTNTGGTIFGGGNKAAIWLGLFNSAGSPPVPGGALGNAGLTTTAGSAFATGNCQNWQGYVASITSNGTARVVTRPMQTSTESANQALLGNGASSGTFANPGGTAIETAPITPITLTPGGQYTIDLSFTLIAPGVLTVTNHIYNGAGTSGTVIFMQGSTNATTSISNTTFLTSAFDGLAIGYFNSGASINPVLDISSITITGQSTINTNPPVITSQPISVSVPNGASCSFSVGAIGLGLTYQWSRNGAVLHDGGNISGATTSQLVVSPAGPGDVFTGANGYFATVTGIAFPSNLSTNSTTADLTLGTATSLIWTGNSTAWNLSSTTAWQDSGSNPQVFNYGDPVAFTDFGAGGNVILTGSYLSAASVDVNSASAYNFSSSSTGSFAGPGALTYEGTGQLTIGNANTYTGGTIITNNAGLLVLANYAGLGTGPVILAKDGGTMELQKTGTATSGIGGNVEINANYTLNVDSNGTFAAVLLSNLDGITGKTLTINNVTTTTNRIRVYGTNAVCNANIVLIGNATSFALSNGTTFAPYLPVGTQTYNGVISGNGGVVQRGNGTSIFTGQNTYTGGTVPSAGTIGIGADSTPTSGTVISSPIGNGALFMTPEVGSASGSGTVFASGGAHTIANPIQYPSSVTTQTLIISGSNSLTFTGPVTLNGNDGETTPINRTFTANNTGLTTLSGVISDGGLGFGFTKNGSNTLVLNNTETYTGPTAVTAGTLFVNGSLAAGSAVTVSNATLGGLGTINGSVTIQSNAVLSPGNGGIGALAINNTLTLLPGSTNIFEVNSTGAHDSVTGLTSVAYAGTLNASNLSGTVISGQTFQLFSTGAHSGNFTNIIGTPGAGLAWAFDPTSGKLSAVTGVSTNSTNITFTLAPDRGSMTLQWPANHLGWRLQTQTNNAGIGITTNWVTVAGSTNVTQEVIPFNPASGASSSA